MEQYDLLNEFGEDKNRSAELFEYRHGVFSVVESTQYMQKLIREVSWEQRSTLMYGKEVITPRLTAWFGDPRTDHSIRGTGATPAPWTDVLLAIKQRVESLSGISLTVCF